MLAHRGTISEVARKVGRKVVSASVKLPERALVAPRSISQTCLSVRSSIWPKLAALRGLVSEAFGLRRRECEPVLAMCIVRIGASLRGHVGVHVGLERRCARVISGFGF